MVRWRKRNELARTATTCGPPFASGAPKREVLCGAECVPDSSSLTTRESGGQVPDKRERAVRDMSTVSSVQKRRVWLQIDREGEVDGYLPGPTYVLTDWGSCCKGELTIGEIPP